MCARISTPWPSAGEVRTEQGVAPAGARATRSSAPTTSRRATLIELAADADGGPPPVGLELVFTVAEESGLRGAKELDLGPLRS